MSVKICQKKETAHFEMDHFETAQMTYEGIRACRHVDDRNHAANRVLLEENVGKVYLYGYIVSIDKSLTLRIDCMYYGLLLTESRMQVCNVMDPLKSNRTQLDRRFKSISNVLFGCRWSISKLHIIERFISRYLDGHKSEDDQKSRFETVVEFVLQIGLLLPKFHITEDPAENKLNAEMECLGALRKLLGHHYLIQSLLVDKKDLLVYLYGIEALGNIDINQLQLRDDQFLQMGYELSRQEEKATAFIAHHEKSLEYRKYLLEVRIPFLTVCSSVKKFCDHRTETLGIVVPNMATRLLYVRRFARQVASFLGKAKS